jgi:hypothetical protein
MSTELREREAYKLTRTNRAVKGGVCLLITGLPFSEEGVYLTEQEIKQLRKDLKKVLKNGTLQMKGERL